MGAFLTGKIPPSASHVQKILCPVRGAGRPHLHRDHRTHQGDLHLQNGQKKLQGEVSLTETLESGGDGNSLSLMDVIAVDDDMLEELDTRDACEKVRQCVQTCLSPRERKIIVLRYGLSSQTPHTQREVAAQCGISRSYVSQRR